MKKIVLMMFLITSISSCRMSVSSYSYLYCKDKGGIESISGKVSRIKIECSDGTYLNGNFNNLIEMYPVKDRGCK